MTQAVGNIHMAYVKKHLKAMDTPDAIKVLTQLAAVCLQDGTALMQLAGAVAYESAIADAEEVPWFFNIQAAGGSEFLFAYMTEPDDEDVQSMMNVLTAKAEPGEFYTHDD